MMKIHKINRPCPRCASSDTSNRRQDNIKEEWCGECGWYGRINITPQEPDNSDHKEEDACSYLFW